MVSRQLMLDRITARLKELGLSDRAGGLKAGLGPDFVRDLRRHDNSPKIEKLVAMAAVLGVTTNYLLGIGEGGGDGHPAQAMAGVTVRGSVQAGVWREAMEWDRAEWFDLMLPVDRRYASSRRYGLRVCGTSMDRLYPEGSIVVVVPFDTVGRLPKTGDKVVVVRRCATSSEMEATLKEYERDAKDRHVLWPRSTDPEFQSPIILDGRRMPTRANPTHEGDDAELTITALVIGSYRVE